MSDLPPKTAPARKTGLSPKEQKLQALREKLARANNGTKQGFAESGSSNLKAKNSFAGKKTAFQRKAT